MRSFLVRGKKPIIKWGMLPENTLFQGNIPEGFDLAISPSGNYIVVDVDINDKKDGFSKIPINILQELQSTLNYNTKNLGKHFWLKYTGSKKLANKTSGLGIDLRTNKGYVVWYNKEKLEDCLHLINNTSEELNTWLESLFYYAIVKK